MAEKRPAPPRPGAVPEIYADRAESVSIRAGVARLALVSERPAGRNGSDAQPILAGHIAMPVPGFLQLFGQMRRVVQQLEERGLITAAADSDPPSKSPENVAAGQAPKSPAGRNKT